MPISSNVYILTADELDRIKDDCFQRGVKRGRFEESFDRNARVARNCANWKDGRCETCGVQWQDMVVGADHKCTSFIPPTKEGD